MPLLQGGLPGPPPSDHGASHLKGGPVGGGRRCERRLQPSAARPAAGAAQLSSSSSACEALASACVASALGLLPGAARTPAAAAPPRPRGPSAHLLGREGQGAPELARHDSDAGDIALELPVTSSKAPKAPIMSDTPFGPPAKPYLRSRSSGARASAQGVRALLALRAELRGALPARALTSPLASELAFQSTCWAPPPRVTPPLRPPLPTTTGTTRSQVVAVARLGR